MKIYISGKITGTADYMSRFETATRKLEARGYEVVNPATVLSPLPQSTTWAEYMLIALKLMEICDKVYFLKGWEESKGARVEMKKALARNMIIELEQ